MIPVAGQTVNILSRGVEIVQASAIRMGEQSRAKEFALTSDQRHHLHVLNPSSVAVGSASTLLSYDSKVVFHTMIRGELNRTVRKCRL